MYSISDTMDGNYNTQLYNAVAPRNGRILPNKKWTLENYQVFSLRCQIEESERERDARPTLEEVQAFSERIGRDYKKLFSK